VQLALLFTSAFYYRVWRWCSGAATATSSGCARPRCSLQTSWRRSPA